MAFDNQWRMRDDWSVAWRIFAFALVFVIIGTLATGLAMWLKPVWLGFERKAFKASHQYIEGHQAAIQTLKTQLADLDTKVAEYSAANKDGQYTEVLSTLRSQQVALKKRIAAENAKLPIHEQK